MQTPLTECPRCGDVFVFCHCLENLLKRLTDREQLELALINALELRD